MKKIKLFVFLLGVGIMASWSQDVIMESDNGTNFILLESRNTVEATKVAIEGLSSGDVAYGYNIGVQAIATNYSGLDATVYGIYASASAYNSSEYWAGSFAGYINAWDFITTSDLRAKKNIEPLSSTLNKVMQLKPKTYQLTESYTRQKKAPPETIGLIAQDLESVFPQLVREFSRPAVDEKGRINPEGKSEKLKGVSYNGLIPVLIKAMQEQQAQIEALKIQVASLKK